MLDLGVAIRQGGGAQVRPSRVKAVSSTWKPTRRTAAVHARATDQIEPAVEVDHHPPPGRLVRPGHVATRPIATSGGIVRDEGLEA